MLVTGEKVDILCHPYIHFERARIDMEPHQYSFDTVESPPTAPHTCESHLDGLTVGVRKIMQKPLPAASGQQQDIDERRPGPPAAIARAEIQVVVTETDNQRG